MAQLLGPANMAEIRDDILTDIVIESAKTGIIEDVSTGSDNHNIATGVAGACMLLHARIDSSKDACTPFTAVGEDLRNWQQTFRLPEVPPSRAAGKVRLSVTGTASVPDGQPGALANGQRFRVVGNWSPVINGSEVDVLLDAAGSAGNAAAGAPVTILNPPTNVTRSAVVSQFEPITGGFDVETEERRKERVLNRTGTNAGGGNWGQLRGIAFDSSPAVQQCFVYPALAGPGTHKVVPLRRFDRELNSYSRSFPSGSLDLIRSAIQAVYSTAVNTSTQASVDEPVDVSVQVSIPNSTTSGGNGSGWLDATPWPQLEGSETRCVVTSVSPAGVVTLDADTAVSPIAGQTRVAWWSPNDMRFHSRTIITAGGGTAAWILTLDTPFVDTTGQTPSAGDYISPASENIESYGATWVNVMEALGAGENTANASLIENGRALRHPFQTNTQQASLTSSQTGELKAKHAEIIEISYSYRSATVPTLPAALVDAPHVFVPRHFGIYPT